jgi:hypothetical protein
MRRAPLIPILMCPALGCQSGSVISVQTSRDGDVLVFQDAAYRTVYAASARGVQRLGEDGTFTLSPDGRWVLIFQQPSNTQWRGGYSKGDRLTLVHLDTPEQYVTTLPFDIPAGLLPGSGDHSPTASASSISDDGRPRDREAVKVCFGDAEIHIGLIDETCWRWRPRLSLADAWDTRPATECHGARLGEANACILPDRYVTHDIDHDHLVVLPSDGWNALRTVWVRPDGSSVELLRKNDAPLQFLIACVVTVGAPVIGVVRLVDSEADSIGGRIDAAAGMVCLSIGFSCVAAWQSIEVDPESVKAAQAELRSLVADRQAAKDRKTSPATRDTREPCRQLGRTTKYKNNTNGGG